MNSMKLRRVKVLAAAIGSGAAVALAVIGVADDHGAPAANLAGSGASATSTNYAPPTIPQMNVSATAMSRGATVTATSPSNGAAEVASPTVAPPPAAACSNNGVVLPGGCH